MDQSEYDKLSEKIDKIIKEVCAYFETNVTILEKVTFTMEGVSEMLGEFCNNAANLKSDEYF